MRERERERERENLFERRRIIVQERERERGAFCVLVFLIERHGDSIGKRCLVWVCVYERKNAFVRDIMYMGV